MHTDRIAIHRRPEDVRLNSPTAVLAAWAERVADPRLPLALRVVAYAEANAGPNGHAPLTAGELVAALDLTGTLDPSLVTRAIRAAVRDGWLHHGSSARCLVLARADLGAPCNYLHPLDETTPPTTKPTTPHRGKGTPHPRNTPPTPPRPGARRG